MMSTELSAPLKSLLETIDRLARGEVDVEVLQAAVRLAEDSVTEHELRDLRKYLQSAEGKLELIRFTVDSNHVVAEALKVAQDVGSRVRGTFGD
jgi:hypothetical protein